MCNSSSQRNRTDLYRLGNPTKPGVITAAAAIFAVMALGAAPQPATAQTTSTSTTSEAAATTTTADPSKVAATPGSAQIVDDKDTWNGSTDPTKAPLLVPGGAVDGKLHPKVFQDKFNETSSERSLLHWDVELKEDERIAFSYLIPPKDNMQQVDPNLQFIPFIIDENGRGCVAQKNTGAADNSGFVVPFSGYISSPRVGTQDQDCKPGKYKISLERRGTISPSVELPFQFMLWKIPRADETAPPASTSNAPNAGNPDESLPLGDNTEKAPQVNPGNYSGSLEPNKLQWFKVNVAEGQRLHLDVDAFPIGVDQNASQSQPITLEWRVLGPTLNPVLTNSANDGMPYNNLILSTRQSVGINTATDSIQWINLEKDQGETVGEFLSGEHWVALRYYRPQAPSNTPAMKFNMAVAVSGTALSAPQFIDNLTGQAATDVREQEAAASSTESKPTTTKLLARDDAPPEQFWMWAVVASVVASLGAVGGIGILRGRSKTIPLFH
ncbi:MAG: hypothetical protein Q4A82_07075 [Corynebacterium sp.]|nr:hypothetical protein [Corynebacterium sp.]